VGDFMRALSDSAIFLFLPVFFPFVAKIDRQTGSRSTMCTEIIDFSHCSQWVKLARNSKRVPEMGAAAPISVEALESFRKLREFQPASFLNVIRIERALNSLLSE
jgi:hypothetical protein